MPLSEQDKELLQAAIREGAREAFKEEISDHVAGCPHGKNINLFKARLVGIVIGAGAFVGIIASVATVLVRRLLNE